MNDAFPSLATFLASIITAGQPAGGSDLQSQFKQFGMDLTPPTGLQQGTDPNQAYKDASGYVWMLSRKRDGSKVGEGDGNVIGAGGRIGVPMSKVYSWPWSVKGKQFDEALKNASAIAGRPITNRDELAELWRSEIVPAAAASWADTDGGRRGRPLTPFDVMRMRANSATLNPANKLANSTRQTVNRSVTDVSPGDAWKVINSAVTSLLGRAATTSEVQEFAHKANQIAANNPNITTTSTKYDKDGQVASTNTSSKGGFTDGDLALEAANMANSDPEAGAFQAAGPLYNAFLQAISNPFELDGPG